MEAKKITLKTLAASIAAVLMAELLLRPAVSALFISPLPGIAITRIAEIVLLLVVVVHFEKSSRAIGLAPESMPAGIKKGLIWSALFGIVALFLILLLHAVGINALRMLYTPLPFSQLLVIIYLAVGGIIGPVAEEIFFRGILYGYLRRWGVYPAVVLSTAFFVLPHMNTGHLPITQLVGGIVFALAYEKVANLMAPITIHCLGNLAIFSIGILA
jgi:membrane protease YdiL (CAAX protease family)